MMQGLSGTGRGLPLTGAILLLAGCASAPSSEPTVAPHEHDSHASSDATPSEARDDHSPVTRIAGADAPPVAGAQHEHASAASEPSEQEAYERARPVFARYCASCHTSGAGTRSALLHFTMDRYPFAGHHADQISSTIRDVLGANGQPATMPKDRPGVVQGDELRIILDWANAFDRAHATGKHGEHRHEH